MNALMKRCEIVGAWKVCHDYRTIAGALDVPYDTVKSVVKSFLRRGTVTRKKGSGRPRKTTPRSDRIIVRLVRQHPFEPTPLILWRWGEPVSRFTLSRRLKEASFRRYRPAIKPFLSPLNIENRLNWSMARVAWRLPMFRRIVWSDESRFRLFKNDGRVKVWRMRGERYRSDLMLHTSQGQGGSVHVWGAFWYGGRTQLQILEANVNGERYCETIRNFLNGDNPPPRNWIFQQDNAPAHTSRVVTNYFEEVGVHLLPWPSKSPDLNPIEHVWDFLGREVAARFPMNLMQLRNFLVEEWNRFPQNVLNHLVEDMPRRINAVIEARGRNTKY